MSALKISLAALVLVVGASTLADAAPRYRTDRPDTMQRFNYSRGTLPYEEWEGRPLQEPFSAAVPDANTRAAEAFQDHFRNTY